MTVKNQEPHWDTVTNQDNKDSEKSTRAMSGQIEIDDKIHYRTDITRQGSIFLIFDRFKNDM
jgi:hypothetical protein